MGDRNSSKVEADRIAREMDRILHEQAKPNRPSPLAERWAYLDKVAAQNARRALSSGDRE